ncbi:hypothetical protein NITHO_1640007 [Nitrolancea hollandica Lb]|uniref:Uncharacterized protein n=1 Tax=Nitrolancea hollandica Lb TaxID=1129897 RepID=I4EDW7_9BACT|nr:hypothetical protein NITHO_1640007 [Nitrolancea hollandica Lb]
MLGRGSEYRVNSQARAAVSFVTLPGMALMPIMVRLFQGNQEESRLLARGGSIAETQPCACLLLNETTAHDHAKFTINPIEGLRLASGTDAGTAAIRRIPTDCPHWRLSST